MVKVETKEQLIEAIKKNELVILIVNQEIARPIKKMKALKKIAWVAFSSAITAAVGAFVTGKISLVAGAASAIPTGGAGAAAGAGGAAVSFTGGALLAGGAATLVGLPTAITLLSIAVISGGFAVLSTIRDKYSLELSNSEEVILRRK